MKRIYLSPHLDDAAFSCGGLIWEQARTGTAVEIWTICAGDPPPGPLSPFAAGFHTRWESGPSPYAVRRQEDRASCAALGAVERHFPLPDCIYRRSPDNQTHLYASEEALFGPLHPTEVRRSLELAAELEANMPPGAYIVCPLGLGKHVDHQLTRRAAELIRQPRLYYADFPYVLEAGRDLEALHAQGWSRQVFPISPLAMQAWVASIAAHASQMNTFWASREEMQAVVEAYARQTGDGQVAVCLWAPPGPQEDGEPGFQQSLG